MKTNVVVEFLLPFFLSLFFFLIFYFSQPSSQQEGARILLPTNVVPHQYHIHLTPNFTSFDFEGYEEILVKVVQSTSSIKLHAQEIQISEAIFVDSAGKALSSEAISFESQYENCTIQFPQDLPIGNGKLKLKFRGILNDKMAGFYRSKYLVNGQERWMATTQFEPTAARKAFPCWDEPLIKAKFQVTLSIPSHLQALSNMPVISTETSGSITTLKFENSPIMSTYLVAFVVGEFDWVEGKTKEGVNVRVYTPVGKKEQGKFALDVAVKTLSYFSDYYAIPYPLPKMDMIAIPDFAAGAMENWGLITYREIALLIDEQNSGVSARQRVAYVVGHELAHQWFGNLVTMEWWKELWLNEGFATFVGQQAVNHLFPQWDMWTQFVTTYTNKALNLDALENSHPIEVEVKDSAQIGEIFDQISYSKGAAIIRMISEFIGESNFRKGLNIYLKRFQYGNAVTEDLWKALGEASGVDVRKVMEKWTKETGFPLISVIESSSSGEYTISQSRFYSDGRDSENESRIWWIPLSIYTTSGTIKKELTQKKETISIPGSWFKLNLGQSSFYRVKYPDKMYSAFDKALQVLAPIDRLGLQNDAFALAKATRLSTAQALVLAKSYSQEMDYTVWLDLASNLAEVGTVWANQPNFPQFKKFLCELYRPLSSKLGWDKNPQESDLMTMLRPIILGRLGLAGDIATIQEAQKRFQKHVSGQQTLPADLRAMVYQLVVANGNRSDYDKVLEIFMKSDLHEERLRALQALGFTQHVQLIEETLEFALSSQVRPQDIFYVTLSTSANPIGRELAWRFLQKNWSKFVELLGDTQLLLARVISQVTKDFASEEKRKEVETFFKDHPFAPAERTIKQSLENIRGNAKWLSFASEDVARFLAQY